MSHTDLADVYVRRRFTTNPGSSVAASESTAPTQAETLLELARDAELFHTPEGREYATVRLNGHRETWAIGQKGLELWLGKRFFELEQKPPGKQALDGALDILRGRARFDGEERRVFVRLGHGDNEALYLDRGTSEWDAVKVTAAGWEIVAEAPVRFRRPNGLGPLPVPERGGSIEDLRGFINMQDDDQWVLLCGWMVAALWPSGPYPILVIEGEQGSAKSGLARVLRGLLDPCTVPLGSTPRDERDLMIAATNSLLVSYDNLSVISHWLSDALCRLSTGGGMRTRGLYTDDEEIIFDAQRPVILTGIANLCERDDLRDRALVLTLSEIPESARRSEAELAEAFRPAPHSRCATGRPRDGNASDPIHPSRTVPRMADFARLATAAEPGLGLQAGDFLQACDKSRVEAIEASLDLNPVATALLGIATPEGWTGTASELLRTLTDSVTEQVSKSKEWPKTATTLSRELTRIQPALRKAGIGIVRPPRKGHGRTRLLQVRRADAPEDGGSFDAAEKLVEASAANTQSPNAFERSESVARGADAPVPLFTTNKDDEQGDAWEGEAA